MKEQGTFQNVAVGSGAEIFYLEYVLQYVSTAKMRCSPVICENLDLRVKNYYSAVSKQILRSTEGLDRAIKESSPDFSYWVDMEKEKLKTTR